MELLELYLSPLDAQRFQAIATRLPIGIGDAATECVLPFWVGEQDWRRTIIKVLESSQGFRAEHYPEPDEQAWLKQEELLLPDRQSFHAAYLERIGQSLYHSLFPPDSEIKQAFLHSLRLAEQHNTDLHLRLKFAADSVQRSRLADYPWELIHDGQRFLQPRQVIVSRYIAYEALPPALLPQKQLRVLLIAPRVEDATQKLAKLSDTEQQAIHLGLSKAKAEGLAVLESLSKATLKALSADLSQRTETQMPQVLHFDGHGLFGKRCVNSQCGQIHAGIKVDRCRNCGQLLTEPTGFLLFEDEQGGPDYVSAASLVAFLPKGVALVVLSACQSGMAVAGDSVFNGTAQQLIDARVPAVVAMQYGVRVDAVSRFAEQFYRILGQKKPLVTALNEGRKWMGVEGNQWYRPVLYLRWLDNQGGQLFAETATVEPLQVKLSRFQRFEIERLQVELEDLDQDYESVKAQLRVELDAPTQNKLERQIEQIGRQMDTKEQQLFRLKQQDE
ncbi:CHAT domain-containing protein [Leptolyngbya sp. FACHB-321]|uniref:CHAT domain-containing protein n=1 Tax=Leptolyngbya sp. FACHB-321 TaxID=2692807 RepID=UPI0016861EEB|nr:CHAT domain-containing protein [Leptolyngbya sp. FACHB-321]MBD2036588.1 CHAT domain-containing protein [Leptolyngbya sp. FACHB-321]